MFKRLILLLSLLALLTTGCEERPQWLQRSQLLMGTVVEITVLAQPAAGEAAIDAAFAEMRRIEELMSSHVEQSDVWRISHGPGPIKVSEETAAVLQEGLQIARQSHGAFDMTLGRLIRLWGIETDTPHLPTAAELQDALKGVGPGALGLQGRQVSKTEPQLMVDLGGIAKGYAIDRAIDLLAQAGIHQASVNAGGDIRLLGRHGDRPWKIGIQHPRQPEQLLTTLELESRAVVTSGDYERFFERDGVRYHHLFDPQTGRPARKCQSVTVVTDRAMVADALATAAFVLGPRAGMALLRQQGAEGIIVAADGSVTATAGLQSQVKLP